MLGRWILDALAPIIAMIALVGAASIVLLAWRSRALAWRRALSLTASDAMLLMALGGIGLLTLGQPLQAQPDRINLVPFRDQIWAAQGLVDPALAMAMLIGNVLLFVPLGMALAFRWPGRGTWTLVLLAAGVSGAVEATQALMNVGRLGDVTDVIANTAGALLGVLPGRALRAGGMALIAVHRRDRTQ
ncbi:MAG TPA: VanZ family protein [Candidatus Limnocylindrales bacterium]|nr:VanZ family protein [Candidatus Limnocylindrales bacterium]